MAQFRAVIRGQRGEASRLGSKSSGITAHIDGWNSGVEIHASVHKDGQDVFGIYVTGGSNHSPTAQAYIGCVTIKEYGSAKVVTFIPAEA